ncbi:hypothetical protein HDV05_002714 [Chytridiales sp. JEL 0842]|nr:hypothetical protein HDV05_002714 [Chytridiales sp. JEL 0842]
MQQQLRQLVGQGVSGIVGLRVKLNEKTSFDIKFAHYLHIRMPKEYVDGRMRADAQFGAVSVFMTEDRDRVNVMLPIPFEFKSLAPPPPLPLPIPHSLVMLRPYLYLHPFLMLHLRHLLFRPPLLFFVTHGFLTPSRQTRCNRKLRNASSAYELGVRKQEHAVKGRSAESNQHVLNQTACRIRVVKTTYEEATFHFKSGYERFTHVPGLDPPASRNFSGSNIYISRPRFFRRVAKFIAGADPGYSVQNTVSTNTGNLIAAGPQIAHECKNLLEAVSKCQSWRDKGEELKQVNGKGRMILYRFKQLVDRPCQTFKDAERQYANAYQELLEAAFALTRFTTFPTVNVDPEAAKEAYTARLKASVETLEAAQKALGAAHDGRGEDLIRDIFNKIKTRCASVNWDAARFFSLFDVFYTPEFRPDRINKKKSSGKKGLPGVTKSLGSYLSHSTFRKMLGNYFGRYNQLVSDPGQHRAMLHVSEAHTTAMCFCGTVTKPGSSKVFACSNKACRIVAPRDGKASQMIRTLADTRVLLSESSTPPSRHP